ncbi:MAG: methyltransferase family protein [Thermoanaerobaculia bacterium]
MARHPPPIWILLVAVVLVYGALSVAVVRVFRLPSTFTAPAWLTWIVGGFLILAGMAIYGFAIRHLSLRRAFGREIYASPAESVLVTTGPYAYLRNPLYLGAAVALIGWSLLLHSVILAVATVLMIPHFVFVAKWEERELLSRLGEKYDAYRRATPLFIPRLPGRKHRR